MSDQPQNDGRALVLVFDTSSTVIPISDSSVVYIGAEGTVFQNAYALEGLRGMFLAESPEDAALIDIFSA